ncbi:hypothetical protein F8388_014264 [Cannabis sativa]|uniref:Benzyl alcohol O-benzoyltransferase n=1 Tax=Cannabis sativa TaxID=3483 RepID=A0A7J6GQN7_CANSA|nr:hypothetical protein G4B88_008180 [Cannabis sativa]KAF4385131.1 hypothetical protein F8388_014264 [Cannabis sativa]
MALVFKVRRSEPQLVAPAKPTPKEIKLLSDIDDQEALRFHVSVIQFYKYDPSMKGIDPAKVIKQALAKTLFFYYPFAGRLRELPGTQRKLAVDCTAEGVLFIEADADVTLKDFGDALQPPFPCLEDLIFDVPGSSGLLNSPLILIQVTRLACGGFIFALRLNHTMSDGAGLVQFMTALGEIARGADSPSILPVWQRELLNARNPPRVTCEHREYDQVPDTKGTIISLDDMSHRSFFFGPTELAALRKLVPPQFHKPSTFELLSACLWKCRTAALKMEAEEEVRIICIVNGRSKFNPPLPQGYYGNGIVFPVAVTTAGKLCENPIGYALELVKRAKDSVTEEYMRSVADLLVSKGRPHFSVVRSYLVSDLTHAGFGDVDVGWGKAVFGGTANGAAGAMPGVVSDLIPFNNMARVFKVRRSEPQLVAPAKPTPKEIKLLSDIDDQEALRFHIPVIQFYKYDPSMKGIDPAKVITQALAKTLVFYYPFAGRLRELPGTQRKLAVDCTAEGVLFIEADADVTLKDFGDALQPPFPCLEDLIFDVPGSSGLLNSPLILIQVTRLACGGFIFALRFNHTMSDGAGMVQFMTALGEIARGADSPSILPVWQRELLNARNPPRVTCEHREYDQVPDTKGTIISLDDMSHRSFFFGPTELAALRKLVPPQFHKISTFELLSACLWKCRTAALKMEAEEEVRIICIVNGRSKFNPPLPQGYYGNGIVFPVAVTTAGKLCENPIGYALELVKRAKDSVTEEYMRSVADLMVSKGRPHFSVVRSYLVSDLTHAGFGDVDVGWGKAVFGGTANGAAGAIPGVASVLIPFKNMARGEQGIVVPLLLPTQAMDIFITELDSLLKPKAPLIKTTHRIPSSL